MQKVYLTVIILLSMVNFAFAKDVSHKAPLKKPRHENFAIFQEIMPYKLPMNAFIDADGKERFFEEYEGKYLLVHFWATWCLPCLHEMPKLNKFAKDMRQENLVVLPISIDYKGIDVVKNYYSIAKIKNVPVLLDPKHKNYDHMNFYSVPATALIDPKGNVMAVANGSLNWDDEELRDELSFLIN